MSDDLAKRLRETTHMCQADCELKMKCADRIEELEAALEKAVALLSHAIDMTGELQCYHDHHGYCQAHNLEPRGECWVELSQALIEELKGQDDE